MDEAKAALDTATSATDVTAETTAVSDAQAAVTAANPGLKAGTFAGVKTQLQAGELLFVVSEVNGKLDKTYHDAFAAKLTAQSGLWTALEAED